MPDFSIRITFEELHEIAKAFTLLANSPDSKEINWEIIAKFLAKLDNSL